MVYLLQVECPEFPDDLKHWVDFISASSQALRAESGLEEKNKWDVAWTDTKAVFLIASSDTVVSSQLLD